MLQVVNRADAGRQAIAERSPSRLSSRFARDLLIHLGQLCWRQTAEVDQYRQIGVATD